MLCVFVLQGRGEKCLSALCVCGRVEVRMG